MNEADRSNQPRKKFKQTSILEFITISSEQQLDSQSFNSKQITNNTISNHSNSSMMASTSAPNTDHFNQNHDNCNQLKQDENLVEECHQVENVCSDNNSIDNKINQTSCQINDQSVDNNNSSQALESSQIPVIVLSDDELEDETKLLRQLNRIPDCLSSLVRPLRSDPSHYVLYYVPLDDDCVPKPYPSSYIDKWDARHVKMPNSHCNQIIAVKEVEGHKTPTHVSKWELIQQNLLSDIRSLEQLEEAIKTYNPIMKNHNFHVLHSLFSKYCDLRERDHFFNELLPKLINLTLQLPLIVTQSVPLLKQKQNATLFLSQQQIACLLANAFFCTFPKRSRPNEEFKNYPVINFFRYFTLH